MPGPFTDEDRARLESLLDPNMTLAGTLQPALDHVLDTFEQPHLDALTRALAYIDQLEGALRRLEAVGTELDDTSPAPVWDELSAALVEARAALLP